MAELLAESLVYHFFLFLFFSKWLIFLFDYTKLLLIAGLIAFVVHKKRQEHPPLEITRIDSVPRRQAKFGIAALGTGYEPRPPAPDSPKLQPPGPASGPTTPPSGPPQM